MNLNQITIPSHDLVKSVNFYQTLGLRLIVDSVPRYARFECPAGDATFSVHHVDNPVVTGEGITKAFCFTVCPRRTVFSRQNANSREAVREYVLERCSIYFECEDLDGRVQALTEQGIVFDLPPTDQEWLWREAHLRDPDGNRLILYHAGTNRKHPPWRIES